jgi:hypothetical protein
VDGRPRMGSYNLLFTMVIFAGDTWTEVWPWAGQDEATLPT